MKHSNDLNFSYSGVKTAALYKTKELREEYERIVNGLLIFVGVFLI